MESQSFFKWKTFCNGIEICLKETQTMSQSFFKWKTFCNENPDKFFLQITPCRNPFFSGKPFAIALNHGEMNCSDGVAILFLVENLLQSELWWFQANSVIVAILFLVENLLQWRIRSCIQTTDSVAILFLVENLLQLSILIY